jgi:hypothetical protein
MLPALTGLVASTGPVIEGGEDGKVNEIPDGKPAAANEAAPLKQEDAVALTTSELLAPCVTPTEPQEGEANGAAPPCTNT